jgi:cob(I)alamin adenosyltransferase
MTIYTKTGDDGTSATLTGERLSKTDAIFEANGTVDELSAALGLVRVQLKSEGFGPLEGYLADIQQDLILVGAYLSSGGAEHLVTLRCSAHQFEQVIDRALGGEALTAFIISGENELEARLHVARTVCRRCERRLAVLQAQRTDPGVHGYVNRMSDLLFSLAVWSRSRPFLDLQNLPEPR